MDPRIPQNGGPSHWPQNGGGPSTHTHYAGAYPHPPVHVNRPAPDPYANPTELTRIYPFTTYMPTARAASYISPHHVTYPPLASPAQTFPQYAEGFSRISQPVTQEDWRMRQESERRIDGMLRNSQLQYAQAAYPSPAPSHASASPEHEASDRVPPLPYSFLSPFMPMKPSTPASSVGVPSPSTTVVSAQEYFDAFINKTLHPADDSSSIDPPEPRAVRASSTASTPNISRSVSRMALTPGESPDPLSLPGPSPTKRHKSSNGVGTPTLRLTLNAKRDRKSPTKSSQTSSALSSLPSSRHGPSGERQTSPRKTVVVELSARTKAGMAYASSQVDDDEEDDSGDEIDWRDGGRGDDEDWTMDGSNGTASPANQFAGAPMSRMTGSARTGGRDMRSVFEKLQTALEDIFEESDSFPADLTPELVEKSKHFYSLSRDGATPLLSSTSIEQLVGFFTRLNGSRKRSKSKDAAPEYDEDNLKKLFRLLERNIREADGVNPFPEDRKAVIVVEKAEKKPTKKGKKGTSRSPDANGEDQKQGGGEVEMPDDEVLHAEARLEVVKNAALAAECCLAMLDVEGLSKPMYSEDLLSVCVANLKDILQNVIFPLVSGLAGEKVSSRYLSHVLAQEQAAPKSKLKAALFSNPLLSAISQSVLSSLPHLTSLISRSDLFFGDSLVIQTVYLAISPLFVAEPPAKGKGKEAVQNSVMKGLRLETLGCLRGAFAKYEDQRKWIVEEILSLLVKLPDESSQARFRLSNGSAIHTITALFLQLIQASTSGIRKKIIRLRTAALETEVVTEGKEKPDTAEEEAQLCDEAMAAARASVGVVATYLFHKSASAKATKSSHDTDYKAILDTFIADLLLVHYRPEWPAAASYLWVFSMLFIEASEDSSTSHESMAKKNLALEYLGDIASKLKSVSVDPKIPLLSSLGQIVAKADEQSAIAHLKAQKEVQSSLSATAREDGMYETALEMTSVIGAQELQGAIKKLQANIASLSAEKDEESAVLKEKSERVLEVLLNGYKEMWQGDELLFEVIDPKQAEAAQSSSLSLSRSRPLQDAFKRILEALIHAMDLSAVALRSKALRGLGGIVSIDPAVLSLPNVRDAIDSRLSDGSPAVRDAAVELIGKYIVQQPGLAKEYYPVIAGRATDTGLSVRKRVVKLLRGMFVSSESAEVQTGICCTTVGMIGDEDDNVKDLAIKSLIEMLYSTTLNRVHDSARLLVDVMGSYEGSSAGLEVAMREVAQELEKSGQSSRGGETVEALINRLIDNTEDLDFDSLSHIRAISLLTAGQPSLIDVPKAGVLLSYLKSPPINSDDQATNLLLLKIFRMSIPTMPRTASTFAEGLSKALLPMIKTPSGDLGALKETVGCFCAVTSHLTRDYKLLTKILRAFEMRVRTMSHAFKSSGKLGASEQAAGITIYITALIVEYCNLDQVALEDHDIFLDIKQITPDKPLFEHLYELFLDFTRIPMPQMAPTLCLGSLFRAYPTLIRREETVEWMSRVFASNDLDNHAKLLGSIHEFLVSQSTRKGIKGEKKQDMDALIGSTTDLSESGLATAVVQQHIGHIFQGAKSHHPPTVKEAMNVLAFTVTQGLYHPLQCMPILISLETSDDPQVSGRAFALHQTLHHKHSSLVNVRFLDSAKASYEYQRSITSEVQGTRDGQALLAGWYSLLAEKRAFRLDFLRALGKAFDTDFGRASTVDPAFVLYIAENLASLEYKLVEEVMLVIATLSGLVTTAAAIASVLEKAELSGGLHESIDGKVLVLPETDAGGAINAQSLIHASVVVCIALVTKNHLLHAFGLTEDKCLKATGKKSAAVDKPAIRKSSMALDYSRVAFVRGVGTVEDYMNQKATFLQMLDEDGHIDLDI